MKCSIARSFRREARLPADRPARFVVGVLAAVLAVGSGCVSQGTYDRAVAERDTEISRLDRELTATRRSVDALDAERAGLLGDMEELRGQIDGLERQKLDLSGEIQERERKLGDMRETYDALVTDLESEVASGQLQIERMREGLTVQLPQGMLFGAGSATISSEGRRMVASLAERIRGGSGRVEVQGHTDDIPLSGRGRFATNWELAGARAAAVAVVLQESGVAVERLMVTSYGEHRPVASNDTPEGRAQNRRIEVRVYDPVPPPGGTAPEPASTQAPPSTAKPAESSGTLPAEGAERRASEAAAGLASEEPSP
jgi:chemotaxis protein MotB